jgi:hypothetical protein
MQHMLQDETLRCNTWNIKNATCDMRCMCSCLWLCLCYASAKGSLTSRVLHTAVGQGFHWGATIDAEEASTWSPGPRESTARRCSGPSVVVAIRCGKQEHGTQERDEREHGKSVQAWLVGAMVRGGWWHGGAAAVAWRERCGTTIRVSRHGRDVRREERGAGTSWCRMRKGGSCGS